MRRLLIIAIAEFALLRQGLAKRSINRFEEDGGRAGELAILDREEAFTKSLLQATGSSREDTDQDTEQDGEQDWKDKTCNPFKRFQSKSYYFDLKMGSKQFTAIELRRVKWPQGLFLKIHINQVWRITQKAKSSHVTFEAVSPPKAKSPLNLSVNLLEDDVTIKTFVVKGAKGISETGIEFTLGSGKKFAFAGGSYYPRARVKRALALSKNVSKASVDKEVYASAGNADVVVTPALKSLQAFLGTFLIPLPITVTAFSFFHESAIFALPLSAGVLPLIFAISGAVGLSTLQKQIKKKRDAELSAAEKIAEVIWCLSSTTERCSPISFSKNCFLVCDSSSGGSGSKVFVRPTIAQKKQFKCT